ncbi:MAG: hypothetical protein HUU16_08190 [Candidatus Omnitrophica bacterium]|nr:hypothetical protein [Candidatus Omnitrophota bacterium]
MKKLYEELTNKERRRLPGLKKRQEGLARELAEVTAEIEAIEGFGPARAARGGRRGRPAKAAGRRKAGRPAKAAKAARAATRGPKRRRAARGGRGVTLREAIGGVLSGASEPMGPRQIEQALLGSKSFPDPPKTLLQQITATLGRNPEFKRIGRGQYKLRGRG